ncbi:MAG: type II secretion system major pseudopilin GspG [Candidatus Brocadiaceae bacterium]|nr:type II secretion system major pseudopilin GspG [Candidatus Brocadiaceae bacterium]
MRDDAEGRLRGAAAVRRALERSGRSAAAGFTLIELMVVAVVLAVLAAAILPSVVGGLAPAQRARAESDVAVLEDTLERFYLDVGRYPTTEEGLRALFFDPDVDKGVWRGPYLRKPLFKDPWGNEYVYCSPGVISGQPYEILSYGKDGQEGGEDDAADVHSWVELE